MNNPWKHTMAAVTGCLTVMAITGVGTAYADTSRIPAAELAKSQPIIVTATTDITANTFDAIPLAAYTYATTDGTDITGYDLATNASLTEAIGAALTAAGATGYDKNDPMLWVVQNLLDSQTSPWSGQLRAFLDALKNEQAVKDTAGTRLHPVEGDTNRQSAQVTPGVYMVLDRTTTGRAAIAGLNGTGINGKTRLATDAGTFTLGEVEYKVHDIAVSKRITAVEDEDKGDVNTDGLSADTEQGRMVSMRLTTTVPNWTGYDKYYLALNDTYSQGMSFDPATAAMTVSVDGEPLDAQYWHVTGAKDGAFTLRFGTTDGDLIPNKTMFPVGAPITVEYRMMLDKDAVAGTKDTNSVNVEYSHNPNTWTDHETKQGDTVSVHTGKTTVSKTDMNGQPLAGAEFQLFDGDTAREVIKTGDGAYRLAEPGESGTTLILATDTNGHVSVNGTDGAYVLKETKSPYTNPLLPQAGITVDVDDKTGAITTTEGDGDVHQMIDVTDGTVVVRNARTLLEMPKTGAAWLLVWASGCVLAALAGVLLLARSRTARH